MARGRGSYKPNPARRITRVTWRFEEVVEATRQAQSKALDGVLDEMNTMIRAKLKRDFPPASKPGQYPRRRTRHLWSSSHVSRKGRTLFLRTPLYGVFLNAPKTARNRAGGRDWIEKIIFDRARHWTKRFGQKARRIMRPTRRHPIRRAA